MIKFAIPNKGALSEGAVELLRAAGYRCTRSGRELAVQDPENHLEFIFLRPRDIALYVGRGIIDCGITGRDLAIDSGAEVAELFPLGFGKSRFCFALPRGEAVNGTASLNGKRIATSYPGLLAGKLAEMGITAEIVRLDGAVEISIKLGVADAIADVVESGATLREAGLEIVGDPMLHSEALLIGNRAELATHPTVSRMIARMRGILLARDYAIVEYDIDRSLLDAAAKLTPGIESPTIAPLSRPNWVAVKAMVKRSECNRIMDELYELGARGIIISDVRSCRL